MEVYYTKFTKRLPSALYNKYLLSLPIELQEINLRYMRWQDRHANLFGKLLLQHGLRKNCFGVHTLESFEYNSYDRPFVNANIDFNISHSGSYVLCAIGKQTKLGIDIEMVKDVDLADFTQVMSKNQWQNIIQSQDVMKAFYDYWAIKESIVKADSRGLSIPLVDIEIDQNIGRYENKNWHLKKLPIDEDYSAFVASSDANCMIELIFIDFYLKSSIRNNE